MNELTVNNRADRDLTCSELLTAAQRELAALFRSVAEVFGREQAEQLADDWLRALEASPALPRSQREWQRMSIPLIAQRAERCRRVIPMPSITDLQPTTYKEAI